MNQISDIQALRERLGSEVVKSDWLVISQARIDEFVPCDRRLPMDSRRPSSPHENSDAVDGLRVM
jgi:hypothetical protein